MFFIKKAKLFRIYLFGFVVIGIFFRFHRFRNRRVLCGYAFGFFFFLAADRAEQVGDDAENQRAGNGSNRNFAEVQRQSADAGNQNHGYHKQVLVIAKVYFLNHLQAGYGDEAVQGDANAAHHAVGNGGKEGYERRHKRSHNRHNRRSEDGSNGSVAGDGHATYRFAVRGVGAAAEERARKRTDTVAEKSLVKTGIRKQILFDNRGKVLVIGDVFRKYHEGNGRIRHRDGYKVSSERTAFAEIVVAFERFRKREVGVPLHILNFVKSITFSASAFAA